MLETLVFTGPCCRLVFQNQASISLHQQSMVGQRFISRSYTLPSGQIVTMRDIRDQVFAGKIVNLYRTKVREHGVDYLLSTVLTPILDRRGRVIGMQSDGYAVEADEPSPIPTLAAWIESLQPACVQSSGPFQPLLDLDTLVNLRLQLAQSLRQIVPPVGV